MMPAEDAMSETPAQSLAAHFEECARLLRAHPELFTPAALDVVGVVAGLSVRTTRQAARERPALAILRDVAGPLLTGVARVTRGDRLAWSLLYHLRRGWVDAANGIRARERRRAPLMVLDVSGDRSTVASSCPRCGRVEVRDLASPAPCACGFVFESIEEGAKH